jgi:hypothetical protein
MGETGHANSLDILDDLDVQERMMLRLLANQFDNTDFSFCKTRWIYWLTEELLDPSGALYPIELAPCTSYTSHRCASPFLTHLLVIPVNPRRVMTLVSFSAQCIGFIYWLQIQAVVIFKSWQSSLRVTKFCSYGGQRRTAGCISVQDYVQYWVR